MAFTGMPRREDSGGNKLPFYWKYVTLDKFTTKHLPTQERKRILQPCVDFVLLQILLNTESCQAHDCYNTQMGVAQGMEHIFLQHRFRATFERQNLCAYPYEMQVSTHNQPKASRLP